MHLRKLEDADYVASEQRGDRAGSTTAVSLTNRGRAALAAFTHALRNRLGGLAL
jgi:DNA-binding MarR family transcriptional regulator